MDYKTPYAKMCLIIIIILLIIIYLLYTFSDSNKTISNNPYQEEPNGIKQEIETKPELSSEERDPLGLSFSSTIYCYEEKEVENILFDSKLGYYSRKWQYKNSPTDYRWLLKSNNKEVYACRCVFDKNSSFFKTSVNCSKGEGYEDFINGDTELKRDYPLPEIGDEVYVYWGWRNNILGNYSDIKVGFPSENLANYEYYWYQRTEEGPKLVLKVEASGKRVNKVEKFNEDIWNLYDISHKNIDIIPYDEFPRSTDYLKIYDEWQMNKEKEYDDYLEEQRKTFCEFDDPEDLYEEYPDEFWDFDEAEDFLDYYCD